MLLKTIYYFHIVNLLNIEAVLRLKYLCLKYCRANQKLSLAQERLQQEYEKLKQEEQEKSQKLQELV